MFRQSSYARMNNDLADMTRRMRSMEQRLERIGSNAANRASASIARNTDGLGDTLATAFGHLADQFRNGSRFGDDAAHYAQEAAKFGNDALRRLSREVEHRPLVMLAVAAGVGFLAGLAGRR
jgi:ElaB/YqjD/DUF883 family membrane-anchored ribosome-binding protein